MAMGVAMGVAGGVAGVISVSDHGGRKTGFCSDVCCWTSVLTEVHGWRRMMRMKMVSGC